MHPVAVDDDEGVTEALPRDAELEGDPSQGITLEEQDSQIKQRRRA